MNKDYKIGDKVWYVPNGYLIAIECVIVDIDDTFRKIEPQAYLFYELDEPVGHNVSDYELYNQYDALAKVKKNLEEIANGNEYRVDEQLDNYRKKQINFVIETHYNLNQQEKEEIKQIWFNDLVNKTYKVNWYNIKAIKELNKARSNTHSYFDRIWKSGLLTRRYAYTILSKLMKVKEAHIKNFSEKQCNEAIEKLKKKYPLLYGDMSYLDSDLFNL